MAVMINAKGTTEYAFKVGAKGASIIADATTHKLYLNERGTDSNNELATLYAVENYMLHMTTSKPAAVTFNSYSLTTTGAGSSVTINNKKIKAVITGYTIDSANETINLTIEDIEVPSSN